MPKFASGLCQIMPNNFNRKFPINYTMTVDKIQTMNLEKFHNDFPVEVYLKKVENHTKNGKTKRVRFGVTDKDIFNEPIICVCSLKSFEMLHNTIYDNKSKINNLESELKKALENQDENLNEKIDELSKEHQIKIDNLKMNYESEISTLKDEIQQLKQNNIDAANVNQEYKMQIEQHQTEIETLKDNHKKEIEHINIEQKITANKEYLDKYNDVVDEKNNLINEKKKITDELDKLKDTKFNYAIQYNALLNEIKNISWFDAVRNKHKDIANNYKLIQLPTDEQSMIDTNKTD